MFEDALLGAVTHCSILNLFFTRFPFHLFEELQHLKGLLSGKDTTFESRSQEGRIDKIVFLEVSDICAVVHTHTSA